MKMVALWLVLLPGFVPLAATMAVEPPADAESQPGIYSVGFAAIDITPAYPIRLNGFGGRRKESEGVRQPIWAKALAVGTTESDTVIVITVDTLGIPDVLHGRIAEKLKPHGIDRSRLAICASHTHSGPMIRDCANTLFGQPIPDDHWQTILKYTDELEARLVNVAIAALADGKPARLSWGVGKVGFAFNRRTPGGPVDHDLPMLAVHEPDGQLRAVFTNYACHCVTLSDDFISGDWAGYAMEQIQRRNPGCHAMISIGCGADSNPRGGVVGMKFDVAGALGNELAEEVQRLLSTELRTLTKPPLSLLERITLKLAPLPTREQWEELSKNQNPTGHHARTQLARLDRGEALMTEISYPVQTISFGDELAWVFLPGEVVVDYALRLKQELDGSRIWMNAYSNACPGYVPSERILREGGYEGGSAMVYYDIPVPYASGLEQTIVGAVQKQLQHNFMPVADAAKTDGIRPLLPSDALSSLRVKPGFRAELVAAEPLIESPVAIAFGPDGKLWVAEMCDYPQGDSPDGGRIKCLVDDNGDGRYDRSENFLTGLPYPTGVTVWRNGVLICAAPDILYAEDTNGDGKADHVEKLFRGFATHNYQARVNSLEYGLDGWVYGSCGLFGGNITSVKTGETIALGQRDFRFHPDTGILVPATGSTQQGRARNDWDDWFGCNNSTMLMHYPLADHYLRHNPYLAPSSTVVGITAAPGRLFSISNQVLFMLSGPPNRPTAACGLGLYRDDVLGKEYHGNAFTCEPVNNLVHRQMLSANGVTFTSRRSVDEQDREFLASTDPWFRPVQVRTGLDGALWVVDMYRYVIEHPIWIPPDTLATLDPRAGSTMGRIYRIVPEGPAVRKAMRIDQLQGDQLAAAMDTANGTQRDLVQQRIQWNKDTAAIPRLMQLATESVRPEVRIQALSTWANLESPTVDVLLRSVADVDPHVRRHAVRLSESQLNTSPQLTAAVVDCATDDDAFVRMQVAYSSAILESADSAAALAAIIQRDDGDSYLQSAAESAFAADNIGLVMKAL
ncbi:MAG: neutral/alkaline non-lysosomal ceramidase N-terminal domain-containing protein, partial [Planctomycetota bacterium]|nr:neutral/alkaline non-lysosomal ceramidase N-terminal domain-containing protein [Planctomycetota bacterium]